MKLVWCSDLHTDHLFFPEEIGLYLAPMGDAVVISGDIATGSCLKQNLLALSKSFGKPIYFVLGNHDIWGSSFEDTERAVLAAQAEDANLVWLRDEVVTVAPGVALTGDDGWYDGYFGDPDDSSVIMRDWLVIDELKAEWDAFEWRYQDRGPFLSILRKYSLVSAARAKAALRRAAKDHSRVVFVTHVPPFEELAFRRGDITTTHWMPWYTSRAMGDALLTVADEFPEVQFEVLCGHTHTRASVAPRPNLTARSAQATYAVPDYEEIIQL